MTDTAPATLGVLAEIAAERARQDARWGEQNHALGTSPDHRILGRTFAELAKVWKAACQQEASDRTVPRLSGVGEGIVFERIPANPLWSLIALEEVGEFLVETDPARAREEAVQAAAVFAAIVESIDRAAARDQAAAEPAGPLLFPELLQNLDDDEADVQALADVIADAGLHGIRFGGGSLARWILRSPWVAERLQPAPAVGR